MADMNVSFGLSYEQAKDSLDDLVAEMNAAAAKSAAVWESFSKDIDQAIEESMRHSAMVSQTLSQEVDRAIAEGRKNADEAAYNSNGAKAMRSLRKAFLDVGNVGHAAFAGVGASVLIMNHALDEAAKRSDSVRQANERFAKAKSDMLADIGMDIAEGLDTFTGVVKDLNDARKWVVDTLADALRTKGQGNSSAAIDAARAAERDQMRRVKLNEMIAEQEKQKRIIVAQQEAKAVAVAEIQARQEVENAAKSLNGKGFSGNETQEYLKAVQERADAAVEAAKRQQEAQDRAQAAQEYVARKQEMEQIVREQAEARIILLRRQGKEAEADAAENTIKLQERINKINESSVLTRDEKNDAIAKATEAVRQENQAIMDRDALEKKVKEDEKRRTLENAAMQQDMAMRGMAIDLMRQQGQRKQADLAALQLETERRILEIKNDQNLSDAKKAELIKRLTGMSAMEAALIGQRPDGNLSQQTYSIGAGFVTSSSIQRQVFGDMAPGGTTRMDTIAKSVTEIASSVRKLAEMGTGLGP